MSLDIIDGTPTAIAKYLREKENKCENPNHKGEIGEGSWWLKDPEWKYWCPNCTKKWWKDTFRKEMERFPNRELSEGGKE